MKELDGFHDLSLPEWGPYSKTHFGLSHRSDPARGLRFDFTVAPCVYRRQLGIPDALRPAGYLPWNAAPDLEAYGYRQQLADKDKIFADIRFVGIRENLRLAECRCVNNTDLPVPFGLHFLASLAAPSEQSVVPLLPDGVVWIDALDHIGLTWATPRPQDNLVYDALRRGEERRPGCVRGGCIGLGWGREAGDTLRFRLPDSGKIALRCMAERDMTLLVNGQTLSLPGRNEWMLASAVGASELIIVSQGEAECKIDGLAFGDGAEETRFPAAPNVTTPQSQPGPVANSRIISYETVEHSYGLYWDFDIDFERHYRAKSMNDFLLYQDTVHQPFFGPRWLREPGEEWIDFVMQPIPVQPGESVAVYAVIGSGPAEDLPNTLSEAARRKALFPSMADKAVFWPWTSTPAGETYRFSRERMAAVTLSNVVYPTWFKGKNVRHHTPGRQWNCLYTWDSGFIGLGLLEFDQQRAIENLNAYLTEPDDDECAFIHHGSMVPVQFYLYAELLNRGGGADIGRYFYPKLRHYYRFMAGRAPSSTMRGKGRDTLIRSWDYFYNSGGWDDYPPQHHIHANGLIDAAPAVGSAHVIRIARIMGQAAKEFGFDDDLPMYRADIAALTELLQTQAWDAEAGVFGYVRHDAHDRPAGILRHESGVNFNLGFDGLSPLIADICTPQQRGTLWDALADPKRHRTPIGLSAVDQSAPYFRNDGYWNGSIWFPHQWFFWKAALDDNRADFAWYIAETALKLFERETRTSYHCYENFSISGERGGGWHHFSGLSCPVLNFFGAYFVPNRLTGGHDTTIRQRSTTDGKWRCRLEIGGDSPGESTLLAVVGQGEFAAEYNGAPCPIRERIAGCVELALPRRSSGTLIITRIA